ncbi:MAG: trypsin-like peptidase domain-containing protein [Nitrososphaerota archaeon]|nr:trypsin-like peptidase domain-containing protein [Aigarchaeota archaeon]MDW8076913.1 trypsin-like peptidase domain-containing protein [Nitrososphaerota archaeon]
MVLIDEDTITSAIEKVIPSVVNVSTIHLLQVSPFEIAPISGVGSGIVFDPNGYVMTNAHVIEAAQRINVTLYNGEVLSGEVIGKDIATDIAVIKVDRRGLQAAKLGDSSKLKVGQFVIAIGNPFGLAGGPTVTAGVISALNRSIQTRFGLMEGLVQTDAAINPGNSGGPLVNLAGEVIAITTAIVPFAQGIGFAIPINTAKRVVEDIVMVGYVRRPWLGIVGVSINPTISAYYNFPVDEGVLVYRVAPNSPAHLAGIREGDIIVAIDDENVNSIDVLKRMIESKKVGAEIEVSLVRGLSLTRIKVKLLTFRPPE